MTQGLQHKIRAHLVEGFITECPGDVAEKNASRNPLEKYRRWAYVSKCASL